MRYVLNRNGSDQVGIAATMCAFLRYDFDAAGDRMNKLQELRVSGPKGPKQSDLTLSLVARYSLAADRTKTLGKSLAEWAIRAK